MSDKAKPEGDGTASTFNPRRFRTTVPYYARYRLPYPDSLLGHVAERVGLKRGDAVLDLGCGPGLLAVPLARAGFAVTAVDPEPDMVAACEAAVAEAGITARVLRGSSFAMPEGLGPFKLVTMGRSFHWMDRAATLTLLDGLVTANGALALFNDHHPQTAENAWRDVMRDHANAYGGASSPHLVEAARSDFRSHEALLLDSAFPRVEALSEFLRRPLTIDDLVGLAFSLSTTTPERLGERTAAFEAELREKLAALSPDGVFTEIAEIKALVAKRQV